ncbi:MAG: hypothetical protein LBH43_12345 [Treponema sp.]|nr:hypothetical protein [Treponema sp.]
MIDVCTELGKNNLDGYYECKSIKKEIMVNLINDGWVVDLGNETCWNFNTKMVVEFEKCGKTYVGKIKDMPIELMAQWAKLRHGERLIKKAVGEAEEVFLRAIIESGEQLTVNN